MTPGQLPCTYAYYSGPLHARAIGRYPNNGMMVIIRDAVSTLQLTEMCVEAVGVQQMGVSTYQ